MTGKSHLPNSAHFAKLKHRLIVFLGRFRQQAGKTTIVKDDQFVFRGNLADSCWMILINCIAITRLYKNGMLR